VASLDRLAATQPDLRDEWTEPPPVGAARRSPRDGGCPRESRQGRVPVRYGCSGGARERWSARPPRSARRRPNDDAPRSGVRRSRPPGRRPRSSTAASAAVLGRQPTPTRCPPTLRSGRAVIGRPPESWFPSTGSGSSAARSEPVQRGELLGLRPGCGELEHCDQVGPVRFERILR
jgi:hypothetical protein